MDESSHAWSVRVKDKGGKEGRWKELNRGRLIVMTVMLDTDMGLGHEADIYQCCHAHCSSLQMSKLAATGERFQLCVH